jgi:hypothetical protein
MDTNKAYKKRASRFFINCKVATFAQREATFFVTELSHEDLCRNRNVRGM